MKKHLNTLIVLSVLYVIIYLLNIGFVVANYAAVILGGTPSLSFDSQLNFAGWGFPLVILITGAVFLMDAGFLPSIHNSNSNK